MALGIVLKTIDYRENDLLLMVLLETGKKISLVCKGGKKMNSKNAMHIGLYMTSDFLYDDRLDKTMLTLKNVVSQKKRYQFQFDIVKSSCASLMCELVNRIEESSSELYELLDTCLDILHNEDYAIGITSFFLAQLLADLGISPFVDGCVNDGITQVAGISIQEGGFVCQTCATKTHIIPFKSKEDLLKFRWLNKLSLENVNAFLKKREILPSDLYTLLTFLTYHTQIQTHSEKFLRDILTQN